MSASRVMAGLRSRGGKHLLRSDGKRSAGVDRPQRGIKKKTSEKRERERERDRKKGCWILQIRSWKKKHGPERGEERGAGELVSAN